MLYYLIKTKTYKHSIIFQSIIFNYLPIYIILYTFQSVIIVIHNIIY